MADDRHRYRRGTADTGSGAREAQAGRCCSGADQGRLQEAHEGLIFGSITGRIPKGCALLVLC